MSINALLSNESLIMHFKEENNDNFLENSENWSSFQTDAVAEIIKNQTAVFQVYTPDGDFKFGEVNAKTWTKQHEGRTYFLAASKNWIKCDVDELISTMQFELAAMWIQIFPDRYEESNINPVEFYKYVNKIALGDHGDLSIQCIGNIADGTQLIWTRPTEIEDMLPKLKIICERFNLKWSVIDNRN